MYRVIYNSLTHFTKSVHLNGRKDFNLPQTETGTLQVYLYMPQALSFIGCGQGSRLRGNDGVESRQEFFST